MSRSAQHPSGFAYHAQALGFSASLFKPTCENIPGHGAISLSQTGGETYSVVRDFDWKGIFHFDEVRSYVSGSFNHGAYNTLATVTVRGLNIANMVVADQIIARVSSRHDIIDDAGNVANGSITLEGSSFQGLRIAGRRVEVRVAASSCVDVDFEQQCAIAEKRGGRRSSLPAASCSLADIADAEDLRFDNGKLVIADFGTIYLATVIFKPGYQRISMLRAELGCPVAGTAEAGAGEGNGTPIFH
jgi:hypothetical protein